MAPPSTSPCTTHSKLLLPSGCWASVSLPPCFRFLYNSDMLVVLVFWLIPGHLFHASLLVLLATSFPLLLPFPTLLLFSHDPVQFQSAGHTQSRFFKMPLAVLSLRSTINVLNPTLEQSGPHVFHTDYLFSICGSLPRNF